MTGVLKVWNPTTQAYEPVAAAVPVHDAGIGCVVRRQANQSFGSAADEPVQFTSIENNTDSDEAMWQGSNNQRLVALVEGWYDASFNILRETGPTTLEANVEIRQYTAADSFVRQLGEVGLGGGQAYARMSGSGAVYLLVGEYVELWVDERSSSHNWREATLSLVLNSGIKGDTGQQGTAGADGADAPDTYADLTDTDMTGLIADDIARWDGAAWKPGKAQDPGAIGAGAWPVGSVFLTVDDADPSTLLGFGTWARIGNGRVLVGRDPSGDADFDTTEETGGAKEVAAALHNHVYTSNIYHNHGITDVVHGHGISDPTHTHIEQGHSAAGGTTRMWTNAATGFRTTNNSTSGGATGVSVVGGGSGITSTHHQGSQGTVSTNNTTPDPTSVVQPYLVVNMWKRTA